MRSEVFRVISTDFPILQFKLHHSLKIILGTRKFISEIISKFLPHRFFFEGFNDNNAHFRSSNFCKAVIGNCKAKK